MLANKARECITFKKLGYCNIWQITNSVINKGKSPIRPLFSNSEGLSSPSDKGQSCLLKSFLRTLTLMDQVSLYLLSLLELI